MPILAEVHGISLSGDATKGSFSSLRRVISTSPVLSKLKDMGKYVEPQTIGARGAALNAEQRVMHDEDDDTAKPNYIVHHEL